MISLEEFERLLPRACAWAAEQEEIILRGGVPLSDELTADARKIGVRAPERVRMMVVEEIPAPDDERLRLAAEAVGLLSPATIGLALRYGIFVRSDYWGDRRLIVHELVHVWQCERLGGLREFLEKYLSECVTVGYPGAPMEQEARRIEAEICGGVARKADESRLRSDE
jgi:hypothetical protein